MGLSVRNLGSVINVSGEQRAVPRDGYSTVNVGIYKRALTSQNSVLVKLPGGLFGNVEWAVKFKREATKDNVSGKVSSNSVLKVSLEKLLLKSSSTRL